jgi:C-terminal processing protease CtpA/Prc
VARPLAGDGPEALPADAADAARVRAMRAVRRLVRSQVAAADVPSAGPPPAPLRMRLAIERPPAVQPLLVDVMAAPRARPPQAQLRWLDGQVAVIAFNRFHPSVRGEIERALDAAIEARALIIDLRGNGGGLLEMYRWFVGRFMPDERVPMRTATRSRGYPDARSVDDLVVAPQRAPLLQPIAILIDGRTASSAELAAVTLAEQRGALLVGEPTCGCAVAVRVEYVLPDGGGLRIAETGFLSARGARMQDAPTPPALRVSPTLDDLRADRDVVLVAAHRRLLERLTAGDGLPRR